MNEWHEDAWRREVWKHWSTKSRENWAIDMDGYVYLCRAVDLVGKALFGNNWKSTEPCEYPDINVKKSIGHNVFVSLKQAEATPSQKEQIFFLLRDHCKTEDLGYSPDRPHSEIERY